MTDESRRRFLKNISALVLVSAVGMEEYRLIIQPKIDHGDFNSRKPTGADAVRLNSIKRELYADTAREFPGAVLPPQSDIVLFTGEAKTRIADTDLSDSTRPQIYIESKFLAQCNNEELKIIMGHELGHILRRYNPELVQQYNLLSAASIARDEQSGRVVDDKTQNQYMDELRADYIALRLTRNPAAFIEVMTLLGKEVRIQYKPDPNDSPHPSIPLRIEAAQIFSKTMMAETSHMKTYRQKAALEASVISR